MLTKEGCLARQQRLWQSVPEYVEWLLIADPRHVYYLSNFWVHPLSFSAGERAWLLLERSAGSTLLGDNFTIRSGAGEPYVDRVVEETWYDHRHSVVNRDHALISALQAIGERLYAREGAVEAEWLPVGAHEVLALDRESHSVSEEESGRRRRRGPVDLGTLLRKLRRNKMADEVELLRQCMAAGMAGQNRAREIIKEGLSEYDVYREIQAAVLEAAGRPALVYGDFRGTNAERPKAGGLPTDYALRRGDLMILDFSVVLDGYRSDFTNTLSVGPPTDQQQMLFELCTAALAAGEQTLKAGIEAAAVYRAVSGVLEDAGYGALSHHTGHGIGLAHPEWPILVPESDEVLEVGDVVTLEPGLYVEGIGGMRYEHNYLIHETGYERLSHHDLTLT